MVKILIELNSDNIENNTMPKCRIRLAKAFDQLGGLCQSLRKLWQVRFGNDD